MLRAILLCATATALRSPVRMGLTLHGSQQSRSPLVNWYAAEAGVPLEMAAPRPSNHPFGQVPFLTDASEGVEIFESGAILLYIADVAGAGGGTPAGRASYTKWVMWANSELDGLCFGAVPGDHRVRGTSMGDARIRSVAVLEEILAANGPDKWLVGDDFSVADAAVGAYLNYVPIFFPDADLSATPATAEYMRRCARRPAFAQAFGDGHAGLVEQKVEAWLSADASGGAGGGFFKKLGL